MASCNMASAASGFMLSPNVVGSNNSASKVTMLMFPTKNTSSTRLVVRAAEEAGAAPPATATPPAEGEAAPKPKPPPIGPKRGAKVC